jgi:hypothetical protein
VFGIGLKTVVRKGNGVQYDNPNLSQKIYCVSTAAIESGDLDCAEVQRYRNPLIQSSDTSATPSPRNSICEIVELMPRRDRPWRALARLLGGLSQDLELGRTELMRSDSGSRLPSRQARAICLLIELLPDDTLAQYLRPHEIDQVRQLCRESLAWLDELEHGPHGPVACGPLDRAGRATTRRKIVRGGNADGNRDEGE